jgi:uncharacterized protein YecA (UPF0149 family)
MTPSPYPLPLGRGSYGGTSPGRREGNRNKSLDLFEEYIVFIYDNKGKEMKEEWKDYFEKRLGDFKEEIIHRFHVISEDVISKVQQVAEGVVNLDQKFDRRMDGLDRKIDEKNQDVLAAIKFSYAELDRRITYLETELHDLKQRVHQIEKRITP